MKNQSIKERNVIWRGSSLKDLSSFHENVKRKIGYLLWVMQKGGMHSNIKALKGFSNDGVYELIAEVDKDTYRTVVAIKIAEEIYVLHCFKKKSKKGVSTPKNDIDLIKRRLIRVKKEMENESNKNQSRKRRKN